MNSLTCAFICINIYFNIKSLFFISIIVFPSLFLGQEKIDAFFSNLDSFYSKYAHNGRVDYEKLKNNPLELNNLSSTIQFTPLDSIFQTNKKAYLINAYNLIVIKQIVSNYPIKSPQDIGNFFDGNKFQIGKDKYTLNDIENDLLRKIYNDNRLHFVLVCGAIGCPPIINRAYTSLLLEEQLNIQTALSLNDSTFVYEKNNEIYLSEIFKWYREDFGKSDLEIIQFINLYRTKKLNFDNKIQYYRYNWQLNDLSPAKNPDKFNLQTYTAGSLLGKGKMDITLFNSLYTQTKSNWKGINYSGTRESFHTSLIQITYGATKNKRVNIGIDINVKASAKSVDSSFNSVSNTYALKNNDTTRFGVASLGPRIRLAPFKKLPSFSLQSTLLIPTIRHPEGNSDAKLYWSDWNRYIWWNQFYYEKTFRKFQLFFEADLLFRLRRSKTQISHLDTPINLFFSYFPTHKTTFYIMSQHVNRFTNDSRNVVADGKDWVIPMNYTAYGVGMKYQILDNMNLEFLYTNFWRGKNSGIGSTFNIGIKYITH